MLTGAASLTAWWAQGKPPVVWRSSGRFKWLIPIALVALAVTSMAGAVTALGDTLFPVDPASGESLMAHVRDDLSVTNHFLVRLRIAHPLIAIVSGALVAAIASRLRARDGARGATRGWALLVMAMIGVQMIIGVVNIALAAPGWIQLVHLPLGADSLDRHSPDGRLCTPKERAFMTRV